MAGGERLWQANPMREKKGCAINNRRKEKKTSGEKNMGEEISADGKPLIQAQVRQGWRRDLENFPEWECKQIKVRLETRQIIKKIFL